MRAYAFTVYVGVHVRTNVLMYLCIHVSMYVSMYE